MKPDIFKLLEINLDITSNSMYTVFLNYLHITTNKLIKRITNDQYFLN